MTAISRAWSLLSFSTRISFVILPVVGAVVAYVTLHEDVSRGTELNLID